MALYWTPLLQVALELVLYALFIIVVFLAFFPVGTGVRKNYISALLWIQCWAPLFAFTNTQAQTVHEQATRINVQASQAFVNWLAHQGRPPDN